MGIKFGDKPEALFLMRLLEIIPPDQLHDFIQSGEWDVCACAAAAGRWFVVVKCHDGTYRARAEVGKK